MTRDEAKHDSAFLIRIISTLYALANLTDGLRLYPRAIVRFVLWLLRPAERLARDLVIREACARKVYMLPEILFEPRQRNGRAEAERMAHCFEARAWSLEWLTGLTGANMPRKADNAAFHPRYGNRVSGGNSTLRNISQLISALVTPQQLREDSS